MGKSSAKMKEALNGFLLIGICLLLSGSAVWADDTELAFPKHTFALGVGVSYFDWEEDVPPVHVKRDGWMHEVVAGYTYHDKVMLNASLNYSRGELDYDGYTRTSTPDGGVEYTPSKTDTDSYIVECRGLIGYDFMFRAKHLLTPFLGIGYRYWNREHSKPRGFDIDTEYWYAPIGIKTHSPLSDSWTWGMSLEYDLFWYGEVDSEVPNEPRLHLDSGYGARFSLRFGRQLTKNAALSLEPYITYWDINKSDVEFVALPGPDPELYDVRGAWEPESETVSYGLRVSLEF
jgi:hypothetical protein